MNYSARNIDHQHRLIKRAESILILLENAIVSQNIGDITLYSQRYAETLQQLVEPHIEKASEGLTDEEYNYVFNDGHKPEMYVGRVGIIIKPETK